MEDSQRPNLFFILVDKDCQVTVDDLRCSCVLCLGMCTLVISFELRDVGMKEICLVDRLKCIQKHTEYSYQPQLVLKNMKII